MKGALKFRHFVLGAIAIFVYVGIEVGVPGTLNLFLTDPVEKGGAGIASTISGFVVGTYWFLMLVGRLAGASLGAKISSKAMLTFTSNKVRQAVCHSVLPKFLSTQCTWY